MSGKYVVKRVPTSPPEEDGNSAASDGEQSAAPSSVPARRYSRTVQRPRFSVMSINASSRVSTTNGPRITMFEGDDDEEGFELFELADPPRRSNVAKVMCVGLSMIVILLLVAVIYIFAKFPFVEHCQFPDSDVISPRVLTDPGVFDDLTETEYSDVYELLMTRSDFNLTSFSQASVTDNYIYMIDLYLPGKGAVLTYLLNGGDQPPRIAKVTLVFGNDTKPSVRQYLVTLSKDQSRELTIEPLLSPDTRSIPLPNIDKPLDKIITKELFSSVINNITEELYPILMQRFNLCYHNCTKGGNCARIELFQDNKDDGYSGQFAWARFLSGDNLPYTYPLGLDVLIDYSSPFPELWSVRQVVLGSKEFNGIYNVLHPTPQNANLANGMTQGKTRKSMYSNDFVPEGKTRPRQGPKLIEPEGKRYTVHGQHVVYNNWDFFFHVSATSGLELFNIKFQRERVIYEISLQQILTPHTRFISPRLIGEGLQELVRGVDCPDTAGYLDSTVFVNSQGPKTTPNSICVFENNVGIPYRRRYQRNTDGSFGSYFGQEDYYLVIRTISTIGLFDYILDYQFRSSGEIEVKVSTTGSEEIEMAMDNAFTDQMWNVETLNSHIFAFKVDIDINGTTNRLAHVSYERQSTSVLGRVPQVKLATTTIASEALNTKMGPARDQYFYVYNSDAVNGHGQARSFKLVNKSPVNGFYSPDNGQVFSTRYKDSEARVDFSLRKKGQHQVLPFILSDNEGLLDTDLVSWVTIGSSHVTSSEDIPSSTTPQNTCSFSIAPHNFKSESPTLKSIDNIWVHSSSDGEGLDIETFGRNLETTCFHKTVGPWKYEGNREH